MKVLVTGGAGFIGSHIADLFIEHDYEVVIIDNLSSGNVENVNRMATFYHADITSEGLDEIFNKERPDFVIHQAAQSNVQGSFRDPYLDANVNILGTIKLLDCCKMYNVQKVVYASSAAVYGVPQYLGVDEEHPINPLSFYGISKYTPEQYIRMFSELSGIKYTILRYANVYGIRQGSTADGGVISIFIDKFLGGQRPIIYGDGTQTRDFIFVKDVSTANLLAIQHGDNEIFNISCNQQVSINDLVSILNEITSGGLRPIYEEARVGDIPSIYLDNKKALERLNWCPRYSLWEGTEETIRSRSKFKMVI